ncbi:hypothetical protein BDV41DRAFT_297294 [Aspergillus transmontanensis]|uniref:Uncharacterized protein n=1 Tax=Aspergillus transmontanensis TaxID=1034304 RepID=A0A5N6VWF8_9EURO|nr:hypothetical protein BDV41DRAFT_297294 [Aspergillus transmontanensis]
MHSRSVVDFMSNGNSRRSRRFTPQASPTFPPSLSFSGFPLCIPSPLVPSKEPRFYSSLKISGIRCLRQTMENVHLLLFSS